jgi:pyruvate,water dikinase
MKEFDPKMNIAGKILVASHTDPGWTLLFLNAKAVIVERGNALSHASIVARELEIPAIVGIEGICDIIKNDDRVLVNGSTGELTIL